MGQQARLDELVSGTRVYYVPAIEVSIDCRLASDLMIRSAEAGDYPAGARLYFARRRPGGSGAWFLTTHAVLAMPHATEKLAMALFKSAVMEKFTTPYRPRVMEVREERVVQQVYPLSPLQALARVAE